MGFALRNYHDIYGTFPPAHTIDQDGKPSASWRILLLAADPAYSHIYNAYNFDEPWDGANNRKLAAAMPSLYKCPNAPAQQGASRFTSYAAVVGPGAAFQGGEPVKIADSHHFRSQTILIAEVVDSGINWMEPRDLDVSKMSFLLNDPTRPSISSADPSGPGVIFAYGRADRLDSAIPPDALKAMTTLAGGEVVEKPR